MGDDDGFEECAATRRQPIPSDTEIAWAAGLFEGEGFVCKPQGKRTMVRAGVEMTDRSVLEKLHRIFAGRLWGPRTSDPGKPRYSWYLDGWDKVEQFYGLLIPHLSDRRILQFEVALRNAAPVDHRLIVYQRWVHRATHCKYGHAWDEQNTGWTIPKRRGRKGAVERYCRACHREKAQRRRAKRTRQSAKPVASPDPP